MAGKDKWQKKIEAKWRNYLHKYNTVGRRGREAPSMYISVNCNMLVFVFHGPLQVRDKTSVHTIEHTWIQSTPTHKSLHHGNWSHVTGDIWTFYLAQVTLQFNYFFLLPMCQFMLTKYLALSMSTLWSAINSSNDDDPCKKFTSNDIPLFS